MLGFKNDSFLIWVPSLSLRPLGLFVFFHVVSWLEQCSCPSSCLRDLEVFPLQYRTVFSLEVEEFMVMLTSGEGHFSSHACWLPLTPTPSFYPFELFYLSSLYNFRSLLLTDLDLASWQIATVVESLPGGGSHGDLLQWRWVSAFMMLAVYIPLLHG